MAGRPPEVDHVKTTFFKEIQAAEDLVTKIRQFKGGTTPQVRQEYILSIFDK